MQSLYNACLTGDVNLVGVLISQGITEWNDGFIGACRGGHEDIAKLMISKGATNLDWGLYESCFAGQRNIIQLLLILEDNTTLDYNVGLYAACQGGHESIAELLISKGATLWNAALDGACQKGHRKLINLMISKGATNTTNILRQFKITALSLCEHGLPLEQLLRIDSELHYKVLTFRQCIQSELSSFLLMDLVNVVKDYSLV